jgi:hypothetical protein
MSSSSFPPLVVYDAFSINDPAWEGAKLQGNDELRMFVSICICVQIAFKRIIYACMHIYVYVSAYIYSLMYVCI